MALTKDSVLVSPDFVKTHSITKKITFNLQSGASLTYSMSTILGASESKYDPASVRAEVLILDTDSSSVFYNYYVDGRGAISVGIKNDGSVRFRNEHSGTLQGVIVATYTLKD